MAPFLQEKMENFTKPLRRLVLRSNSGGCKRKILMILEDGSQTPSLEDSSTSPFHLMLRLLLAAFFITFVHQGVAVAQTKLSAEEQLEQDFTDPLSTLPQIVVRDAYTPANYGTNLETNQLLIRPLIPRIPTHTLLPLIQLIRPTFSLVTVPSSRGGSRTEFGDLPLFDIAVLPWPKREDSGLLIGIGPTLVFPTATSRSAGQGAWQAGPALGAIYTGIPGLLVGFVLQNPVSFAYTSPDRPPQNTLEFQPVLALHLWKKFYLRSAEANWNMGWRHNSPTTLPLSVGIGRTFVRPGLPPMSFFVTGQWMAYRQYAPIAAQNTINFGMTIGFPELREW
jgi:hypothetical protein